MTIAVTINEIAGAARLAGQVVARVGPCSLGTVNQVYEFAGGDGGTVEALLGHGRLAAETRRALAIAQHASVAVPAAIEVAGSIGAVNQDGGGPLITITATPAAPPRAAGPWFDAPSLTLEIMVGGALGAARARVLLDGFTPSPDTFNLPPEYPAFITGTVDLNTITLASLNTLTVDLTDVDGADPAAVVLSTPTDVADLISQIDAIVGASASLVGGKYLRISGATLGSGGSITNGAGTANALLGITNGQTAVGIDSTYEVPGLGCVMTFPAGTYEKGTTYAAEVVGPRTDLASSLLALDALRDSGVKFGLVTITQEPADGLDLAVWQAALEAKRIAWATAEENPIFVKWVIASPLGVQGSANWAANDQDVKTNLSGTQEVNKLNTIAHGDVFLEFEEYGAARFRAPLVIPYLESCAKYELSVNPGLGSKGALPKAYLKSADGTVRARTEGAAIVKMQDAGFSVLLNEKETPFIRSGVTRAQITSQFTGEHTARMALVLAGVAYEIAFRYKDSTPRLAASGDLEPVTKGTIQLVFNDELDKGFVRRGWASSIVATLQPLQTSGGSDLLPVRIDAQRLGHIKDATITINVTADAVTVEG